MPRSALPFALFVLCALSAPARAQFEDPPFGKDPGFPVANKLPKGFDKLADVELTVTPAKAKWGETVTVKLTVRTKDGGTTYPFLPSDHPQTSRNTLADPMPVGDLVFTGKVVNPTAGLKRKPRESGVGEDEYYDGTVTWEFKAVVSPLAKPGKKTVDLGDTAVQVCKTTCITASGAQLPAATLEILEGVSEKASTADLAAAIAVFSSALDESKRAHKLTKAALELLKAQRSTPRDPVTPTAPVLADGKVDARKTAKDTDIHRAEMKSIEETVIGAEKPPQASLWAFIATAALWGLISLVTPCVFPMIPITVSIFLKQAHGSFRERLKLAGVYSLTIISVLGLSAFALLKFMAWLSTHPLTNILLAALFLVLALSLFGMYELSLPNSLQKRLQAKQSKGGVVGTIFGALAFTVISFTCVAPFLGGFAGISAGNDSGGSLIAMPTAREVAGGLAFATAFAAPFFILALVPGLLKALPRSGGWLDSVKVVMGFLELAAALKFFRTAELRLLPTTQYFTYDVVFGGWIAISAACGLYLLNIYRLPHDEEKPNIGVPRLLFALLFLGLALYLTPALFKGHDGKPQRPAGATYAWVEAFLLPEDVPQPVANKDDVWRTDLQDAITASKNARPIFLDFTGVTCTNCKLNERDVFPQAAVREELQNFEKVKLYTDEVPASYYLTDPENSLRKAEAKVNREFQNAVFKDYALPLYAVLMPQADGKLKVVGVYPEGKINDPAKFAAFLKESLEKAKKK